MKEGAVPVRKKLVTITLKLKPLVKLELEKMEKERIIFSIRHSKWISNLVGARKKNGAICLCVDFWDCNQTSLKDNDPLPNMESLLQQVTSLELMSMPDGFSSCDQVLIVEEDKYKIAFIVPWGMYAFN